MKQCIACQERKPLADFYTHPQTADGHLGKCKLCCRKYAKGRPDMHKMTAKRKKALADNAAKFRREHPEKYRAQTAVNNAVRDGKLVPQGCEKCGKKAHAHHDDYSKLLDVRWLCPKHHSGEHHAIPF